ncbi:unnamed protein product [Peniophora sp. CBMAI 1063]|nr:unnamed protein product [Peniophora sp. CBMAI 1063]
MMRRRSTEVQDTILYDLFHKANPKQIQETERRRLARGNSLTVFRKPCQMGIALPTGALVLLYIPTSWLTRTPAILAFLALIVNGSRGLLSQRLRRRVLRDVPGPAKGSIVTGNLHQLYAVDGLIFLESLSSYGNVAKIHGLLGDTILVISDPRALSHILAQDAHNFPATDVSGTLDMHLYLLGPGLLSVNGSIHRRQRKLLNPVFSHTQMRNLAPIIHEISRRLRDVIITRLAGAPVGQMDCAEWLGRAGLEMIAQAGFGHTFHSLEPEDDGGRFVHAIKDVVPSLADLGPIIPLFMLSGAAQLPPRLLRVAGDAVSAIYPPLRRLMRTVNTMHAEMCTVFNTRMETHGDSSECRGKREILGILHEARAAGHIPDYEATSQAVTLAIAGTETTSTLICRILHLLSLNPTVQESLREELSRTFPRLAGGGEPDFDTLMALPLLEAVCKETLRLFAPAPYRNRRCTNDCVIPLSDGTSVQIPANTEILANLHGLNIDETIWGPHAKEWQPERWLRLSPPHDAKIPGVWGNIMSFGGGAKACIGLNFALMETKTVLATLLTSFSFSLPAQHVLEWRFGPTLTPGVKGDEGVHPSLPLCILLTTEGLPSDH